MNHTNHTVDTQHKIAWNAGQAKTELSQAEAERSLTEPHGRTEQFVDHEEECLAPHAGLLIGAASRSCK